MKRIIGRSELRSVLSYDGFPPSAVNVANAILQQEGQS